MRTEDYVLRKGSTGLELWHVILGDPETKEDNVIERPIRIENVLKKMHICHSDQLGDVLDFLCDNFEKEVLEWADKENNR